MKKVVRMLGLCALVALAFTACKKDDTQKVTFTATVTQPTSNARTHAVGYGHHLVWDAGDQIKVFNNAGTDMDFALPGDLTSAQQATFNVTGNDEVNFISNLFTEPYYAFYPEAAVNGMDVEMTIPATQEYVPQRNFASNLYPMVGFNVDENGQYCDNFQFVSDCGFLNVSITCPEVQSGTIKIGKVILRALNVNDFLNGTMCYQKNGSFLGYYPGTNEILMQPKSPVTLVYTAATDFTFVLPGGALWSGFVVEVYDENDVMIKSFEGQEQTNIIEPMTYTLMLPVTIGDENQIVILP